MLTELLHDGSHNRKESGETPCPARRYVTMVVFLSLKYSFMEGIVYHVWRIFLSL